MKKKLTAIDLFSGAGGLHLGFEESGYDVKLCIDNNDLVEKTHKRNFPHIPMINGDIRDVTADQIREYLNGESLDVIIGGPPCQGFSTIGHRASSDPNKRYAHDARNELVLVYANLIKELRPKFIVMENVKGILTLDKGAYLENVMKTLHEAGYNAEYRLINMADYGVPEIRNRVIIIGNRVGLPVAFPNPDHSDNPDDGLPGWAACGSVLKDLVDMPDNPQFNHVALKHTPKNIERYKLIPQGGRLPEDKLSPELYRKNFGNTFKRLDPNRPALTMVPGNDAFPIHPTLHRSLTVREAARIQSFDDEFVFWGAKVHIRKQIGNAVPPLLAEAIANRIAEYFGLKKE